MAAGHVLTNAYLFGWLFVSGGKIICRSLRFDDRHKKFTKLS